MPVAIGGRGDEGGANVLQEKAGGKAGSVAVEAHGGTGSPAQPLQPVPGKHLIAPSL